MLRTVKATDLNGNPKDTDSENRIRTRKGYGVWVAKEGGFASTVESLKSLIGSRLYLIDTNDRYNDILSSKLTEVNEQDGLIQLVTENTIYFLERVSDQ